jgi:hypothetical protein
MPGKDRAKNPKIKINKTHHLLQLLFIISNPHQDRNSVPVKNKS